MKQLTSTKIIPFLRFPANWKSKNNSNNNNNNKETLTNSIWRNKLTKNQGSCWWRSAPWLPSTPPAYKYERKSWMNPTQFGIMQFSPWKNKSDGNRENLCDKMIPGQNHNYLFLLFCLENEENNLEKENRLCEWGSHLALSAFHLVPRSECSYSTVTMKKVRKCDFQCGVHVCGLWNSFITYDGDRWGPLDARLGTRAVNRAWLHWSASMTHQILNAPRVS